MKPSAPRATLIRAPRHVHRDDFRHFRVDQILNFGALDENLAVCGKTLFRRSQAPSALMKRRPRERKPRQARQGAGLTVKMPVAKPGENV
jgi:predicted DNA-binding transcriptional regulator YafY